MACRTVVLMAFGIYCTNMMVSSGPERIYLKCVMFMNTRRASIQAQPILGLVSTQLNNFNLRHTGSHEDSRSILCDGQKYNVLLTVT